MSAKATSAILNDANALDSKYGVDAGIYCAAGADGYLRYITQYAFKWDETGFLDFTF